MEHLAFLPVQGAITDEVKRSLRALYSGLNEQQLKTLGSELILLNVSAVLANNPDRYRIALQLLEFLEMPKPREVSGAPHELAEKTAKMLGITFTAAQVTEFDQKVNDALRSGAASIQMEVTVSGQRYLAVVALGTQ